MKFSVQSIKKSKLYRWVYNLCNTNIAAKIIIGIIIWGVAFIPMYFYILVRWGINPIGFWQEIALFLTFAVLIGWLQALLLFFAIVLTVGILLDEI